MFGQADQPLDLCDLKRIKLEWEKKVGRSFRALRLIVVRLRIVDDIVKPKGGFQLKPLRFGKLDVRL